MYYRGILKVFVDKLSMNEEMVKVIIGGIYRHFKGRDKLYEVVGVAIDCETLERRVIYKQLYESNEHKFGTLWSRLEEDFMGEKELGDGSKVKRFELVR